jgi:hypothetical protein
MGDKRYCEVCRKTVRVMHCVDKFCMVCRICGSDVPYRSLSSEPHFKVFIIHGLLLILIAAMMINIVVSGDLEYSGMK